MSASGESRGAFGCLLRRRRESAGLTQDELAQRSGLTARAINEMERGRSVRPYPRSVRLLADALELPEQARTELQNAARGGRPPSPADGPDEAARTGQAAGPASSRFTVPRQLPAGVAHFPGRERELKMLDGC